MRRLYGWLFTVGEGIGVDFAFLFFNDLKEVLAVLVFNHWLGEFAHAVFGDPTTAVSDGFEAGDFETLTFLDDFDEGGGFTQRVVGTGIEPCETTAEGLYLELTIFQETLVDGGDFVFATG